MAQVEQLNQLIPYAAKSQLKAWARLDKTLELLCLRELVLKRWGSVHFDLKGEMEERDWYKYLLSFKATILGICKTIEKNDKLALEITWRKQIPNYSFWVDMAIDTDAVDSLKFLVQKVGRVTQENFTRAINRGSFFCLEWLVTKGFIFNRESADLAWYYRMNLFYTDNIKEELRTLAKTRKAVRLCNWLADSFGLYPRDQEVFERMRHKVKLFYYGLLDQNPYSDPDSYFEFDNFIIFKKQGYFLEEVGLLDLFRTLNFDLGDYFYKHIYAGSLEWLDFALEKNVELDLNLIHNVEVLTKMVPDLDNHDLQPNVDKAAANGSIDFLDWAEKRGVLPTKEGLKRAALEAHVKVLKWGAKRGIYPDDDVINELIDISEEFIYEPIRWFLKRGIKPSTDRMNMLCEIGYFKMLLLLAEFNVLPDREGARMARAEEHTEVVDWLALKGVVEDEEDDEE